MNNADTTTWRPVFNDQEMAFLVWELEIAPTTGMVHLQGYLRFKKRKTMASVKQFLTPEVHLEMARGSEEENYNYCIKERQNSEDWSESGTYDPNVKQGRRTDLEDVIKDVIAGMPFRFFYEGC